MNMARFDSTGHASCTRTARARSRRGSAVRRTVRLGGAPRRRLGRPAFAPDGQHVAAATASGKVLIWRLDRPSRPEQVLVGHHGDINTLDYSPDGRIVTAGSDRTVRVWNPAEGNAGRSSRDIEMRSPPRCSCLAESRCSRRATTARSTVGCSLGRRACSAADRRRPALGRSGEPRRTGLRLSVEAGDVRVFRCEVCGSLGRCARSRARSAAQSLTPRSGSGS